MHKNASGPILRGPLLVCPNFFLPKLPGSLGSTFLGIAGSVPVAHLAVVAALVVGTTKEHVSAPVAPPA